MKHSLLLLAATLASPSSAEKDPAVPLAPGHYDFQHRFAEHPAIPSIKLEVTIAGSHIVVVNPVASDPFPAGTLAEGQLMWHAASQQWIIGREPSDKLAADVGGCSDGPETVDLINKIYWTC